MKHLTAIWLLLASCLASGVALFTIKQIPVLPKWHIEISTLKANVISFAQFGYKKILSGAKSALNYFKEQAYAFLQAIVEGRVRGMGGLVMFVSPNQPANFAPFLLQHLTDLVEDNAPQTKIEPTGFLKACLENDPMIKMPASEKLRLNTETGNIKQVRLSYLQRGIASQTQSTDDCDNNIIPTYQDFILQAPNFRSFSFFIDTYTLANYMEDAAQTVMIGEPATESMNEFVTSLKALAVNSILSAMDADLIASVQWGVNAVTGVNTAKTVNIDKDGTQFDLTTGFAQVLGDLDVNEYEGTPIFVGNGIFNQWMRSRSFQTSQLGGLTNSDYNDFKYYYDKVTIGAANWGTNNVGVFSKGSFGFVDLNKYVGFRATKIGVSDFFQIALPVNPAQNDGTADLMYFDCQLRGIDCPTPIWNGYETQTVTRGWQLIVSKNFGLFQVPSTAYQPGDSLYGNNGALLYTFTNS